MIESGKQAKISPLYEYRPLSLDRHELSESDGTYLYREFKNKLTVEFPSPATDGNWRLTSQGYVGFIPLPDGRTLELLSKTPLGNLFHMLEYTFDIEPLGGLVTVATLDDFYDRLATLLAKMIDERSRRVRGTKWPARPRGRPSRDCRARERARPRRRCAASRRVCAAPRPPCLCARLA